MITRAALPAVAPAVLDWLLAGDPAIRWQVQRDLLDAPERQWQAERRKVARAGWGAQLLAVQDAAGTWGRGIYSPKWTSTTYTLLQLRDLGLPPTNRAARRGAGIAVAALLGPLDDPHFERRLDQLDLCIAGFVLSLAAYFGLRGAGAERVLAHLLAHQLPDGGWNCRDNREVVAHSSFHTTFNVLDGLQDQLDRASDRDRAATIASAIVAAQARALEFMLAHKLFRSHHTGQVIAPRFLQMSYPPRWHYDVLRGLDYFQRIQAPRDSRFGEAIDWLLSQRRPDGAWPLQYRYSGKRFFHLEKVGQPSRWNTLRALRVLRWWNQDSSKLH